MLPDPGELEQPLLRTPGDSGQPLLRTPGEPDEPLLRTPEETTQAGPEVSSFLSVLIVFSSPGLKGHSMLLSFQCVQHVSSVDS